MLYATMTLNQLITCLSSALYVGVMQIKVRSARIHKEPAGGSKTHLREIQQANRKSVHKGDMHPMWQRGTYGKRDIVESSRVRKLTLSSS